MKKLSLFLPCFIILTFLPLPSTAWNATGHLIIGNIAYANLRPEVKTKVDQLAFTLHSNYPSISHFVDIPPWPDRWRGQNLQAHPHWHYIDVAFSADGTPLKSLIDPDNALWALQQLELLMVNKNLPAIERARALTFFVHIVGDLHQPLHGCTRISAKHPYGDRGGNLFSISYTINGMLVNNLHTLWDMGLGAFSETDSQILAKTISAKYPPEFFGQKLNTLEPEEWVKEDGALAKNVVYQLKENETPSPEYIAKGQEIAEEQVALAGYRLALLLNRYYK